MGDELKRIRYIRALERFLRSIMGYLAKEQGRNFGEFCMRVDKQRDFLAQVEAVPLYKEQLLFTQQLVQRILNATTIESSEEFEKLANEILYASNQLHKNKNNAKYKKDKHAKAAYDEE
ncbi:MAG: hypothetical protein KU37_04865 [Sulfuricurvum sp. PC08-66]|nr:MAG: hypothetical protein KU37_04865 [Sulfuricurvum sp. PC08-66]